MTEKQFSEELAIKTFEEQGVILPGYEDVIAEYRKRQDDEIDSERRIKYVEVSKVMFERLFVENTRFIVKDGLPDDAEIQGIEYITDRNCYRMTFQSEEFRPVAEGTEVPEYKYIEVESEYDE